MPRQRTQHQRGRQHRRRMHDTSQTRVTTRANASRRPRNRGGRGHPTHDRTDDVRDALTEQLAVWIVAASRRRHVVRHYGAQQRLDTAEGSNRERRRQHRPRQRPIEERERRPRLRRLDDAVAARQRRRIEAEPPRERSCARHHHQRAGYPMQHRHAPPDHQHRKRRQPQQRRSRAHAPQMSDSVRQPRMELLQRRIDAPHREQRVQLAERDDSAMPAVNPTTTNPGM